MIERRIQRRVSDSIDFDKDWHDYVYGIGHVNGNYWMGLEAIHQLTTAHDVSLYVKIHTYEGEPFTVKLETFFVGNATTNYTINFSGYSQSSTRLKRDLFPVELAGTMFTTRDRNNDLSGENCTSDYQRGGWWHRGCGSNNLNGNYEGNVIPTATGILVKYIDTTDDNFNATKAVSYVEMIIRTRVE